MNCGSPKPNVTPLHERAADGARPPSQSMDAGTLEHIVRNRPLFTVPSPRLPTRATMLLPRTSWCINGEQANSLHGVLHSARVSLLASILADEHGLDRAHSLALCVGAAVHDCRRHNDRDDPGHGQRAATWLATNTETVTTALRLRLPPEPLGRAVLAVSLHDIPHEAFTPEQADAYRQAPHLVDLLKAADALDRYRLPLTRWWPDAARLRITVPPWLHPLAFDLVVESEGARLDGADHHQSLHQARQTLARGQ